MYIYFVCTAYRLFQVNSKTCHYNTQRKTPTTKIIIILLDVSKPTPNSFLCPTYDKQNCIHDFTQYTFYYINENIILYDGRITLLKID